MAGRPRKPTALHLVAGNPGKRGLNHGEPEPALLNDLEPPAHLTEAAAGVWRQVAPMLRRLQVLTELDVISLEMMCDFIADYRHARKQLGDDFVTHSAKGSEMLSQWLVAKSISSKRAEAFMAKFGMDPVSRSRVMIDPQGDLFGNPPPTQGTSRFFPA
jgi:P27 family predicted phage terminase small subunit